jgi:predicted AAA+ superfamily ATPase
MQRQQIVQTSNKFRSDLEGLVADQLEKQRVEFTFEPSRIKYEVTKKYTPDFLLPNGILIEVKGWFKSEDQRKHKLIKVQHPEIDIRFVFQKLKNKVQGGRFTCQEWCEKYDFKFAESIVPNSWIHERK